ncbi:MAG: hypothetical protein WBL19_00460 [Minisyncoccia bacterium]
MERNRGFIGWLILIIVALALLKYFFNWSIFDAAATEEGKETITYIKNIIDTVWSYLEKPVMWLWDRVVELFTERGSGFLPTE